MRYLNQSLLVSLFLLFYSCSNKPIRDISDQDRMFLQIAGSAGIMEVEMGRLALQHATRPELKSYGEMMVNEHTSFNEEYKELLKRIGEQGADQMNPQNQAMVDQLALQRGTAFDSSYAKHMVSDHKLGVEKFTGALEVAKNEDYISFLKKGLTIVKHHYEEALKLQ